MYCMVVEFQALGYKIRKMFAYESTDSKPVKSQFGPGFILRAVARSENLGEGGS